MKGCTEVFSAELAPLKGRIGVALRELGPPLKTMTFCEEELF